MMLKINHIAKLLKRKEQIVNLSIIVEINQKEKDKITLAKLLRQVTLGINCRSKAFPNIYEWFMDGYFVN